MGIALALALADAGRSVLLLDSGGEGHSTEDAHGHQVDPDRHAPTAVAMRRGLGGTSRWWGGRLVPFDPVDFVPREHLGVPSWPIDHAEVERYADAAARFFGVDLAAARALPAAATLPGARFADIEVWAPVVDMYARHGDRLKSDPRITVVADATVSDIALDERGERVAAITVSDGQTQQHLAPRILVLAAGGVETVRMLLAMRHRHPRSAGDDVLGRFYMGHMSGKIADLVLTDPASAELHDFQRVGPAFARRRLTFEQDTQHRERLPNIAFWADNPRFGDADHGVGLLSLVWAALAIPAVGRRLVSEGVRIAHVGADPHRVGRHLRNVVIQPVATASAIARILSARYLSRPRRPGFLLPNSSGRYALHYHAEQRPDVRSRIALTQAKDRHGVPWANVDLRFDERDAAAIVRAHGLLDTSLRTAGVGHVEYRTDETKRVAAVMAQATDGFHQIGGARMGDDPATSVVDANARVHGIDNLFVASSALFPTSGQANPTFLAVALAHRLAAHIDQLPRGNAR